MHRLLLFVALLICFSISVAAAEKTTAPPTLDYLRDIRPILSNNCFRCHGPGTQEGDLRLDIREHALKGSVIVPGDAAKSKLLQRLVAADDERMPPADSGERLSAAQISKLKQWIEQGATWAPHWAYQAPKKTPLPATQHVLSSPIDAHIFAKLNAEKLAPSPAADRRTLVRRVYLDLLGLLPSPDETRDFEQDDRPDAYQRLLDRLFASPHFGERQARHWLDLARYADSNGYTIDGARSIWPFRDWVIGAFNRDLPFDQFTLEQLAGDLLPKPTSEQLIATGFHRNTPFNEEGGTDPEQFRVERTVDRTNTTGAVWLGLTVTCAQCHNHKYDEISLQEYYQLYAFFNEAEESPPYRLATAEQSVQLEHLQAQLKQAQEDVKAAAKTPAAASASPNATPTAASDANKQLAEIEKEVAPWRTLEPLSATAKHGTTLTIKPDHSVLASGAVQAGEVYTVQTRGLAGTYHAIRLEALTHPDLEGGGPGRASGNFVLSHFQAEINGQAIRFTHAVADYSQPKFDVNDALLNNSSKGWAVRVTGGPTNVDRHAVFIADKPFTLADAQPVTFVLTFSQAPPRYPLGRMRFSVTTATARVAGLPIDVQNILAAPAATRSAAEQTRLVAAIVSPAEPPGKKETENKLAARVKQLQDQIKAFERTIKSSLVFRPPTKPRTTNIHLRGDFLTKGDAVQPGTFAALPPLAVQDRPANRIDLAQWLTRPDHPLTPRVIANRLWQQYFGKGLVETENDFGMQGSLPTHPELLDWLAVDLVEQQWSLKRLHREVVSSATYQQSSVERADLAAKDPNNKLLGRQQRLRLEAEIIRDAALAASGLLSRKLGGPGVYPPQPAEVFAFTQARKEWPESKGADRYRRGVYTFLWRQSLHPLFTTFDGSEAQTACTRRNRSNTPLQALHLANDPAFIELAEGLGQRILADKHLSDAQRIDLAFELCFARTPRDEERSRLLAFVADQKQINPDTAWTMLGRVLLNLDEFICRE